MLRVAPFHIVSRTLGMLLILTYSITKFYILQYYHRGGDGRIALACSGKGNLCVLKFPLDLENENETLEKEAKLWNFLWGTECRVVKVRSRRALLMPFCFHVRIITGKPVFCSIQTWKKRSLSEIPLLKDKEVSDFELLDMAMLQSYVTNPIENVLHKCIRRMLSCNISHDDLKWEHLALWPKFNDLSGKFEVQPILLDLTRTSQISPIEATEPQIAKILEKAENDLQAAL